MNDICQKHFASALLAEVQAQQTAVDSIGDIPKWLAVWCQFVKRFTSWSLAPQAVLTVGFLGTLLLLRPPFVRSYVYDSRIPTRVETHLHWQTLVVLLLLAEVCFQIFRRTDLLPVSFF